MEEERRHEITNLQINMAEIQKDISFIKEAVMENKKNINDFIRAADEKYANKGELKFIQKIVFGTIGAVLILIIGAIMAGIIK